MELSPFRLLQLGCSSRSLFSLSSPLARFLTWELLPERKELFGAGGGRAGFSGKLMERTLSVRESYKQQRALKKSN